MAGSFSTCITLTVSSRLGCRGGVEVGGSRGGTRCFWPPFLSHPHHCTAVNKRLDEWVTHERLDLQKIQFPKKEAKTPTKNGLPGSRPGSPEREVVSRSPCYPSLLSLCSWP